MSSSAALRSPAVVVPQQTTEPFVALDLASALADFIVGINDLVVQPLMISLGMVMLDVSRDSGERHSQESAGGLIEPLQRL